MTDGRVITINGYTVTVGANNTEFAKDTYQLNVPLTRLDVAVIGRIAEKYRIIPGEEITSNKNLYNIINALNILNIDCEDSLMSWQNNKEWSLLEDTEYIPLIAANNPEIMSLSTAANVYNEHILDILQGSLILMEDIEDTIVIIRFYMKINNFEIHDEQIQEKYRKLKTDNHERLLLRPWSEVFTNYFEFTTPPKITYSATGISRYPTPITGDPTIVCEDIFMERWQEISCGMLNKSPNVNYEGDFPSDICVIAGGCITRILNPNFKNSNNFDIDIFVIGNSRAERTNNMRKVVEWFEGPDTYYSINGSVVSVFIIGCPRVFQIISNDKTTPYDVVSTFDASHLQWLIYKGRVFGTAAAFDALRHMTTVPSNAGRFRKERFVKALYNGFNIAYGISHENLEEFNISHLIENPENNPALKNVIADFFKYWYPRDDPTLTGDERDMYILAEIKLHTSCNNVVKTTVDVLKHVTVGGNFETDYAATVYQSLNFNNINLRVFNKSSFYVRDHVGVVRLASDILNVDEINNTQDGCQIICNITEGSDFEQFLKNIDCALFRMFVHRNPEVKSLTDGKVIFRIARHLIERQTVNEVSILKNQHGDPLDVVNDLCVGDQIRILFKILLIIKRTWIGGGYIEPSVHLHVSRITKYDVEAINDEYEDNNSDTDFSDYED